MNKQLEKHRTTVRNRQSHLVTASLMELDTTYKMIRNKEKRVKTNTSMECLREKIIDLEEEFEMDNIEQQDLNAANENVVFNQEDDEDFEDVDYAMDHDDLGVIALLELRNGPVQV